MNRLPVGTRPSSGTRHRSIGTYGPPGCSRGSPRDGIHATPRSRRGGGRPLSSMDEDPIIRILLADPEPLFREAIKLVLDHEPDLLVVAEAETGCHAAALAEELLPDVAI